MTTDNIIKAMNKHLKGKGCESFFLVGRRTIEPNKKFPVYKEFTIIVYLVEKGSHRELMRVSNTDRVISGDEEKAWSSVNTALLDQLFSWIESEEYKTLTSRS